MKPLFSRALALAIPVALALLIWSAVVAPLLDARQERQDAFTALRKVAAGYERTAVDRKVLEAQLKAAYAADKTVLGLASGANAAVVAADLQGQVKHIVESKGGEMRSAQNVTAAAADAVEKIELHHDFTLPLGALTDVLYQVETHTPYLFVDSLEIHVPDTVPAEGREPQATAASVRWILHAYRAAGP